MTDRATPLRCLQLVRQLNRARARGQTELAQQLAQELDEADLARGWGHDPARNDTGVIRFCAKCFLDHEARQRCRRLDIAGGAE